MTPGLIISQIVFAAAASILMYAAFRPYTEKLTLRILLGILSFGVLAAILRTAVRGEPAGMILLNFLGASVWIAVWFAVIHVADKRLLTRRG